MSTPLPVGIVIFHNDLLLFSERNDVPLKNASQKDSLSGKMEVVASRLILIQNRRKLA